MNEECNGLNKKQRPNLKKELNEKVRHNKIRVWKAIRDATGLRCDKVVQGKGTRNSGNFARKFFQ